MIPRRIDMTHKPGHSSYVCRGTSCQVCKLRFECYTMANEERLLLNWNTIKKPNTSPSRVLREIVGGQVYVKGSKKHKEITRIILSSYKPQLAQELINALMGPLYNLGYVSRRTRIKTW